MKKILIFAGLMMSRIFSPGFSECFQRVKDTIGLKSPYYHKIKEFLQEHPEGFDGCYQGYPTVHYTPGELLKKLDECSGVFCLFSAGTGGRDGYEVRLKNGEFKVIKF